MMFTARGAQGIQRAQERKGNLARIQNQLLNDQFFLLDQNELSGQVRIPQFTRTNVRRSSLCQ